MAKKEGGADACTNPQRHSMWMPPPRPASAAARPRAAVPPLASDSLRSCGRGGEAPRARAREGEGAGRRAQGECGGEGRARGARGDPGGTACSAPPSCRRARLRPGRGRGCVPKGIPFGRRLCSDAPRPRSLDPGCARRPLLGRRLRRQGESSCCESTRSFSKSCVSSVLSSLRSSAATPTSLASSGFRSGLCRFARSSPRCQAQSNHRHPGPFGRQLAAGARAVGRQRPRETRGSLESGGARATPRFATAGAGRNLRPITTQARALLGQRTSAHGELFSRSAVRPGHNGCDRSG